MTRRTLMIVAVLISGGVGLLIPAVLLRDTPTEGFQLRAQAMVPTEVYRPWDEACPDGRSAAPVEYRTDGALADELTIYEGELIAVRVIVSPLLGPTPATVDFSAVWPTAAVTDDSPRCAFVLEDDDVSPVLDWSRTGPAAAQFSVSDLQRWEPTVVEIWLEAKDPGSGTTLLTDLSTTAIGDNVGVDPLGRRINLQRRAGVASQVELRRESTAIVDNTIEVTAVVSNPSPLDRSFDVELLVEDTSAAVFWSAVGTNGAISCSYGSRVSCEIGELEESATVEIALRGTVGGNIAADLQVCESEVRSRGVCVQAAATTQTGVIPTTVTSSALFELTSTAAGDLEITTDPSVVSRHPREAAIVSFLVANARGTDVTGIEILGSDCETISRVEAETEDGDAFLEPGEVWVYDCILAESATSEFALAITGTDTSGQVRRGTFSGVVELVDPELTFVLDDGLGGGRVEVDVVNSGRGTVYDVAILLPGCASQLQGADELNIIAPGEFVTITCVAGSVEATQIVAYGADVSGRTFVSRFAANAE